MKLAPAERRYLHRRMAQSILWQQSQQYLRDNANASASACLEAIEGAATEASTVKRAVTRLAERIERTG